MMNKTKYIHLKISCGMLSDFDIYLTNTNISRTQFLQNEILNIYDNYKDKIEIDYNNNKNGKRINSIDRSEIFYKVICFRTSIENYNKIKKLCIATKKTLPVILRHIIRHKLLTFQNEIDNFCISNKINYMSDKSYNTINTKEKIINILLTDNNYNNIRILKLCYKTPLYQIINNIINYQINKIEKNTSGKFDYKLSKIDQKLKHHCEIDYIKYQQLVDKIAILFENNNFLMYGKRRSNNRIINALLTDYFNNDNFIEEYYEKDKRK